MKSRPFAMMLPKVGAGDRRLDRLQQLAPQPFPAAGGEQPGAARPCAHGRNDRQVRPGVEHLEDAAYGRIQAPLTQHLVAALNGKILVFGRQRVE